MDKKEFKKVLQECSEKYRFIYMNKNYYYRNDKIIVVLSCQKSNYDDMYYINFGFLVKEIHEGLRKPQIAECDIMGRFDCKINDVTEYAFFLNRLNKELLEKNIQRNFSDFIVPVMDKGIEEYFRLYPKTICTMKTTLKNYLSEKSLL